MKRFALLLVVAVLAACPKPKSTVVDAGEPDITTMATKIKANFDAETPADPRALDFCKVIFDAPEQKKNECCKTAPVAIAPLARNCAGILSDALRDKNLTFDDAKAKSCAEARVKQLDGCGWVSSTAPMAPDVCSQILSGSLDEGARCRSSLECKKGLRCRGAGPLDPGRCAEPLPDGSHCGSSVDGLSVVVPQVAIDREHPECKGVCGHLKCIPLAKTGEACTADIDCGEGNRCEAGKCASGRIAVGKPCSSGGCVEDALCLHGTCHPQLKEGEQCTVDFDCAAGGCNKQHVTDPHGVCGMKCSLLPPSP